MDVHSKKIRSYNMSRILSKNTNPEILLRSYLRDKGITGYRIHYPVTGKPDVAFPSKKIAIFVNGCFWHGHKCKSNHLPKSNIKFWTDKITENKKRDSKVSAKLKLLGWKVITIWECQFNDLKLNKIINLITT